MFIFFIRSKSFSGEVTSNPFHYEHFFMKKLSLNINGQVRTLEHLDFVGGNGVMAYYALLRACSVSNSSFVFDIQDFAGKSLFSLTNTVMKW